MDKWIIFAKERIAYDHRAAAATFMRQCVDHIGQLGRAHIAGGRVDHISRLSDLSDSLPNFATERREGGIYVKRARERPVN